MELALLSGLHPRCGKDSLIRSLDPYTLRHILEVGTFKSGLCPFCARNNNKQNSTYYYTTIQHNLEISFVIISGYSFYLEVQGICRYCGAILRKYHNNYIDSYYKNIKLKQNDNLVSIRDGMIMIKNIWFQDNIFCEIKKPLCADDVILFGKEDEDE